MLDFLTDGDLGAVPGGAAALSRAYDLVVFPGHDEYVTAREYDNVAGYRNLGGHLMFLSADEFYWHVSLAGPTITRLEPWRTVGRPEAGLVGVGLFRNNRGARVGAWKVVVPHRWPWMFEGMRLLPGGRFGSGGIEIDHLGPGSPPRDRRRRGDPEPDRARGTAQMTYYQTPAGAEVFAAGAFTARRRARPALPPARREPLAPPRRPWAVSPGARCSLGARHSGPCPQKRARRASA